MNELRGKIHGLEIFTFLLKAYPFIFLSFHLASFLDEANYSFIQNHAYEMQIPSVIHIPFLWPVGTVTNTGSER